MLYILHTTYYILNKGRTADDTILSRQTWGQVDMGSPHAAQPLLLDGGPVTEIRAMNGFSRTVWGTSQDLFKLQLCYLDTVAQKACQKPNTQRCKNLKICINSPLNKGLHLCLLKI